MPYATVTVTCGNTSADCATLEQAIALGRARQKAFRDFDEIDLDVFVSFSDSPNLIYNLDEIS